MSDKRTVTLLLITLYVIVAALGAFTIREAHPPTVPASDYQALAPNLAGLPAGTYDVDGGHIVILGAVIRLGSPMPYIHENTAHGAVGITGITVNDDADLVVYADRPAGAQILYASADEDETLARLNIECGVSGGVSTSTVRCYRDGTHIGAKNSIYGSTGNIWFVQIMFVPDGA
jgi:hypothetical protein